MWVLADLAIVVAALLIVALTALHTWGRLKRMNRTGRRTGTRLSGLGGKVADLAERVDADALDR